jgi:hypothetical protein
MHIAMHNHVAYDVKNVVAYKTGIVELLYRRPDQLAPSVERGEVRREGTSWRRTVASSGYQIMGVGRCW